MRWLRLPYGLLSLLLLLLLSHCEDPPIVDYQPRYVVEAFLLVNEPIRNIFVYRSLPVTDTFRYEASLVSDADVRLISGTDTFYLQFSPEYGYFYPDPARRIQPRREYRLEVRFPDGKFATGTTTTPDSIAWIQPPKPILQYPQDTINLPSPDSLRIIWSTPDSLPEAFLISVRSLDTLEYGKYLTPPTDEPNERIHHRVNELDPYKQEVTRWGFLTANWSPTVWFVFKWYGLHEIAVFNPDPNMIKWFKQTHFSRFPRYTPLLNAMEGDAIGAVCSAFVIRDTTFVLKP